MLVPRPDYLVSHNTAVSGILMFISNQLSFESKSPGSGEMSLFFLQVMRDLLSKRPKSEKNRENTRADSPHQLGSRLALPSPSFLNVLHFSPFSVSCYALSLYHVGWENTNDPSDTRQARSNTSLTAASPLRKLLQQV